MQALQQNLKQLKKKVDSLCYAADCERDAASYEGVAGQAVCTTDDAATEASRQRSLHSCTLRKHPCIEVSCAVFMQAYYCSACGS